MTIVVDVARFTTKSFRRVFDRSFAEGRGTCKRADRCTVFPDTKHDALSEQSARTAGSTPPSFDGYRRIAGRGLEETDSRREYSQITEESHRRRKVLCTRRTRVESRRPEKPHCQPEAWHTIENEREGVGDKRDGRWRRERFEPE